MLLRNRLIVVAFFASVALLASYSPLAFFKRRIASVQLVFAVCSASPKLFSAPASFRGDACFAVSVGSGTPALLASSSADMSAAVVPTASVAFAIAFAPVVAASFSAADRCHMPFLRLFHQVRELAQLRFRSLHQASRR